MAKKVRPARGAPRSKSQAARRVARQGAHQGVPWFAFATGVFVIAAIVGIVVVSAGRDEVKNPKPTASSGDPVAGAPLFEANCARCHGADLKGTDSGPPFFDLTYAPNHHGDEAFQLAVRNGVQPHHWNFGPMPAIPSLSRSQVDNIVAYIRQEQQKAGIEYDPSH